MRVRYSLFAQRPNNELDDFQALTQMLPMGFGDDMLRFNGIGENVTWGVYNNDNPTDAQKENFYKVAKWAAERGMGLTVHWHNDESVPILLDLLERVNREVPITALRWSIAHLNDASPETMARMKALGMGWTMQNMMYFGGEAFLRAARRRGGAPHAADRDRDQGRAQRRRRHRCAPRDVLQSVRRRCNGCSTARPSPAWRRAARRSCRRASRRCASIRTAAPGSARDDAARGTLAPGKLADLAVLTKDYLTVPAEEIGGIESLLTMVGGRVVYAAGAVRGAGGEGAGELRPGTTSERRALNAHP